MRPKKPTAKTKNIQQHNKVKCEECGALIRDKCGFKSHMRIHLNIREYPCRPCGKTFIRESCLREFIH